jgi:hypothetical protein
MQMMCPRKNTAKSDQKQGSGGLSMQENRTRVKFIDSFYGFTVFP